MSHYVTIHGHFYQPPRENPWLEAIEVQDSAYPYHDWNQRVTAEAYRPNATSRILRGDGKIEQIVNNYARISFNFGPTLLIWLEKNARDVYEAVIEADRESAISFGGHGSAIAQAYNHIIMPLANRRDKTTQVVWGIEDFRCRFGRNPEGLWLPETAVDVETLEVLAEEGLAFTILAPRQAGKARSLKGGEWRDVAGERIDPRRGYRAQLPSGKPLSLLFYNGSLARAVAFEGLLKDGARLADRLLGGIDHPDPRPQLSHIATDGETYGHHHRFGDMALAFALRKIDSTPGVRLTNYAEFLALHPPEEEVEIVERTAWSCAHGVERWRSDCGCASGDHPGWRQSWRGPLRDALDWLRDEVNPKYEQAAARLLRDPWGARDRYIRVVFSRTDDAVSGFLVEEAIGGLTVPERAEVLMLLELQRHLLLMYTSCGWFFDDVAGIETTQDLAYAGRAVQLAQLLFGDHLEDRFVEKLASATGNRRELPDGRMVYEQLVKPAVVNQLKLCAHYALTGLLSDQDEKEIFYKFEIQRVSGRTLESGHAKLSIGRVQVRSRITFRTDDAYFAAVHLGDHNISCGVNFWRDEAEYQALSTEIVAAFSRADIPAVIRILDRRFGENIFSLESIFRDGQRKLLKTILKQTLAETEALYREIYEDHTPLMRFLGDIKAPVPKAFTTAAEFILNGDLKRAVIEDDLDVERIGEMLTEAELWKVNLDLDGLRYKLTQTIDRLAAAFESEPFDEKRLIRLQRAIRLAEETILDANLWNAQNSCFRISRKLGNEIEGKARAGDPEAEAWLYEFRKTAELLQVAL